MSASPETHPLVVRLRNWVGDVVLAVPMLQRLADAGYALHLVGKPWAHDLLAGHGWPVHTLPQHLGERIALLKRLRQTAALRTRGVGPTGLDALCLPDSFSSALEFRLAGLRALGHAWEGRRWLLGRAVTRATQAHELVVYWRLGDALLGQPAPLPARIGLRLSDEHHAQARALRQTHGIDQGALFICPFAGGTWDGQDKTWPDFARVVQQDLPALGRTIVVCPGAGEETVQARERFPNARLLPNVPLGPYAALLQQAGALLSNDTGPAHLAAAVGCPVVTVMGPSDPTRWHPWGPQTRVLGGNGPWPSAAAVLSAVRDALGHPPAAPS